MNESGSPPPPEGPRAASGPYDIEESLLVAATLSPERRVRKITSAWARFLAPGGPGDADFSALVIPEDAVPVRTALGRLGEAAEVSFDARVKPDVWMRFHAAREASGDIRVVGTNISDLKRTNARLASENEMLEAVIEHADAGLLVIDRNGVYVRANEWFRDKTADKNQDMRGAVLFDVIPEGHKADARRTHDAIFAGQPEPPRDWTAVNVRGEHTDVQAINKLITLPSGEKYGLTTMIDATARRQAEARMRLLSAVLESAPFILWATDAEGKFTLAEGKALSALGPKPGGWVGLDAFEEYKGTQVPDSLKRVLAGEEFRETVALPGPIYFDAWYLPLRNALGQVEGAIGLALDVTKERLVEVELREKLATIEAQRERIEIFTRVINAAPVVVSTIDTAGNFTILEGKGLELLGITSNQLVGKSAFEAVTGTPVEQAYKRALAGEANTLLYEAAPGVVLDNWFLPLRAGGSQDAPIVGAVSLGIDASDRVRVERALREKLELIERQSATIRELATPILKIWDEVVCLPLIGTVDSRRTADIMESLLSTIVAERVKFAVVDLTGVGVVDTTTADHLIRLFKATRLLGAEGVLCGIQPAVAQTIVALGTELGNVTTARTLAEALKWCIARSRT